MREDNDDGDYDPKRGDGKARKGRRIKGGSRKPSRV